MPFNAASARRFYDRFGRLQDSQAFYEDKAVAIATEHGRFDEARAIFELGCGTGRHALTLLDNAPDARYVGVDVSTRMVQLATERLEGRDAEVRLSEGELRVDDEDGSFDRFFSTYVLDLLSDEDIHLVFDEAARLLAPEGRLVLVSLSEGQGALSRAICGLWNGAHALSPTLVGGCRPVQLLPFLDEERFVVEHHEVITAFGVPSEILVTTRSGSPPPRSAPVA